MRHSIEYRIGTGILTCCPSTTPFGLALGPTYPGMINMARETLGFRCGRLSLPLRLLIPAFSLPYAPRRVTPPASAPTERSPTMPLRSSGISKNQITISKQITNHKLSNHKRRMVFVWSLVIWSLKIDWKLEIGNWSFQCFALASVASVSCLSPVTLSAHNL